MALVLGVNSGFVTVAPTSDPAGSGTSGSDYISAVKHTSPAGSFKITELGWYNSNAASITNFEIGLYAADGTDGTAGTLLEVERTNVKTAGNGWKVVTGLNWVLDSSTDYWIAIQIDSPGGNTDITFSGGLGRQKVTGRTTLSDPLNAGAGFGGMVAIYALVDSSPPSNINPKIKISGTFSTKPIKVKIGGTFVEKIIKVKVSGTFQ